ncbi:MAG TPA: hypothetical protein VFV49_05365, partial [Thermoanaerobaculia bacterium]|nr:hypothetical protein [Thermoanaerobaculia bacterium]
MLTHGADRVRQSGDRVILQSAIAKGWTPRTPKTLTNAEHPGTAVLWDEQYYEVVEAAALPSGGVRYVLMPWREDHTIRTFESYDAESEGLRIADHERVQRQRRAGFLTRLSGFVLGYLPAPVQMHLENELGVRATRMTLLSCILPMVVLGVCVYAKAEARMNRVESPVPVLLWPIVVFLALESMIRFFVVMSQGRPMGSLFGSIGYGIYYALSKKREQLPSASGGRGYSVAFAPPPEDVAKRDSLTLKEPLLTLLPAAEQKQLAERVGFDYRRTASGVAWVILVGAALGAFTASTVVAMLIAAAVVIEQALRLVKLRREPTGSIFGV